VSTGAVSLLSIAADLRVVSGKAGTMLPMRVERWDERRDGILSEAALRLKLRTLGYAPLPPASASGAIASARSHHLERIEAVMAGILRVTIEDQSAILTAGDMVFIPGGTVRRLETVGTAPVHCVEAVLRPARG
jgi:mannose-6-phosphate isomerase-like protein (cupin superfamily)